MSVKTTAVDTSSKVILAPTPTVCKTAPIVPADDGKYQSEAELEQELIDQLVSEGYELAEDVKDEESLLANLRVCLEELNDVSFNDGEWRRFLKENIIGTCGDVLGKMKKLQEKIVNFKFDDGKTEKNIRLVDYYNPLRNKLQVINQYRANAGSHANRYDVTILMNGFPAVQIELKRRGVPLREAFNQIERYLSDSFWSGAGLFDYLRIFVISNGTSTRYYSNSVRGDKVSGSRSKRAGSFKMTNRWSDAKNEQINNLSAFASSFLSPTTLKMILTRYCCLRSDGRFFVLRPYQIAAVEAGLRKVRAVMAAGKWDGKVPLGGYFWHATGSGKTLTAFVFSQILASLCDDVDKVIHIVDRKDLDYQTIREFNRWQEGSVNATRSTAQLARQLSSDSDSDRVIVTTIQKFNAYLRTGKQDKSVLGKTCVFTFDECHRSQFGAMHKLIKQSFKKSIMFGFTGTPIMRDNAMSTGDPTIRTTEDLFGKCLHRYTVSNAIDDGNVLPFRVDYINTMTESDDSKRSKEKVRAIDTASALESPKRIDGNSRYILDRFDQKTMHGKRIVSSNGMSSRNGFNAMLPCQSISMARKYYKRINELLEERGRKMNVAIIYSCSPNSGFDDGGFIADDDFDVSKLSESDRDFLQSAIEDYNKRFKTTFSIDGDGFDNYYKDVSKRMRGEYDNGSFLPASECIDLLIVVNMFLTGFDSPILNTMFIDKKLRMHGLVQTFSRTNRVFNDLKPYGNICLFQTTETDVNAAFALYGDDAASGKVLLKPYKDYLKDYLASAAKLKADFPVNAHIPGRAKKLEFLRLFSHILRTELILRSFDEFDERDESERPLSDREMQDYQGMYIDVHDEVGRRERSEEAPIADDIVFETELVKATDIDVDYIIKLVEDRREKGIDDKFIDSTLRQAKASSSLHDKSDLIKAFLERVEANGAGNDANPVRHEWLTTLSNAMDKELGDIITEYSLDRGKTLQLVSEAFRNGTGISESGEGVAELLGRSSRFGKAGAERSGRKQGATDALRAFYDKYTTVTAAYPVVIDAIGANK